MSGIHLQMITPEATTFQGDVAQITLTTDLGEITILPGHLPLVSTLVPGEVLLKDEKGETSFVTFGGFVEVESGNRVLVLTDGAERVEEMDIQQVVEAHRRALALHKETFDVAGFEDAALALAREQARIRVLKKYRAKGFRTGKGGSL